MKNSTLLAALISTLALTTTVQAQDASDTADALAAAAADAGPVGELRLGKLYSFGGGTDLQHGFGLDARYHVYPDRDVDGYIGLFAQGQYELGDAWRTAGGVSFGWGFFGLELGVSHRTETSAMAGSTGLHIGQAFTFGPLSVGARVTIPLYDDVPQGRTMGVQGIEGALTLRLSFGFTVHGERRQSSHGCGAGHRGHGRGGQGDGR